MIDPTCIIIGGNMQRTHCRPVVEVEMEKLAKEAKRRWGIPVDDLFLLETEKVWLFDEQKSLLKEYNDISKQSRGVRVFI